MTLVMVLFTIAVVGGVSAVVSGLVSGGLAEPTSSIPVRALPAGPLTSNDVADLRFAQALRGYRMDQVDAAMDRLAAEVDRLRSLVPGELAGSSSIWEFEPEKGAAGTATEVGANAEVSAAAEVESKTEGGTQGSRADGADGADGAGEGRATWPSDLPAGRD